MAGSQNDSATEEPPKAGRKDGLIPQAHGGALRPGGRKGQKPGTGRPPDAFKAMCRQLASSDAVRVNVERILAAPEVFPTLYNGALKWASEHGYGKPTETVEHSGPDGGPIEVRQVWRFGDKEVGF